MSSRHPAEHHPAPQQLALSLSGDLPLSERLRLRWHTARCRSCQAEIASLRSAIDEVKEAVRHEARSLPFTADWANLEREMIGNIGVGVAAARCIDHVSTRRRAVWLRLSVTLGLLLLFVVGWITHVPALQTERLWTALKRGFDHRQLRNAPIVQSTPDGLVTMGATGRIFGLRTPPTSTIFASGRSAITATYADEGTGGASVTTMYGSNSDISVQPGVSVNVPPQSPLLLQSLDVSAGVLSLLLRNTGTKTIVGITLRVESEAGDAGTALSSLSALPGATVPLSLDVRHDQSFASKPNNAAPLRVDLDDVLFSDGTFFGPNTLEERNSLLLYGMQARRERGTLAALLAAGKLAAVREQLNFGLPETPGVDVRLAHDGSSGPQHSLALNPIALDGPVRVLRGVAHLRGAQLSFSQIDLQTTGSKPIRSATIAILVRDEHGAEIKAASLPITIGQTNSAGSIQLTRREGAPLVVEGVSAFVESVLFADGTLWIPSGSAIEEAATNRELRLALTDCPEQHRLAAVFRRDGILGVETDLKKTAQ